MRKMLSDLIFDLGKCPTGKRMKVKLYVFRLGHFARSKIESESIFLIKFFIITILKKIESFGLYLTKSKNGFHIVFSNPARKGSGFFFQAQNLFFRQLACIYLLNSSGGPQSLNFVITTTTTVTLHIHSQ